ncbi:hypothetical protein [Paraburkholderia acidisoli]|nr:hypothetical protein [Paraburkholderia acidisoli]
MADVADKIEPARAVYARVPEAALREALRKMYLVRRFEEAPNRRICAG